MRHGLLDTIWWVADVPIACWATWDDDWPQLEPRLYTFSSLPHALLWTRRLVDWGLTSDAWFANLHFRCWYDEGEKRKAKELYVTTTGRWYRALGRELCWRGFACSSCWCGRRTCSCGGTCSFPS